MNSITLSLCIYFALIVTGWHVSGSEFCPTNFNVEGYFSRLSPVNIETSKLILANTTSPVIPFNGIFDYLTLKNTGSSIEAHPNENIDTSFVTGGVLCNKKYKFHKGIFYISPNVNGCCSNTIDGKGTPLEFDAIYFNLEYGTFENALKYPNGLAIITFPIFVGAIPNLLFTPLQFILSSGAIKQPNSEIRLLSPLVYIWFDVNFFITEYYAYPGSYVSNGKQYQSAIYIVTPPKAFVSYNQFAAFKNILGFDGKPIATSEQPVFPLAGRPVYKGFGFSQGFQFF